MSETSASLLERLNDHEDTAAWQRMVALYSPLIRSWLRRHGVPEGDADDLTQEVLGIVVREFPRFRHNATGQKDFEALLDQLEDPNSDLSRQWDQEHDQHVVRRLLDLIEPDFRPTTWQAFRRQAIDGAPADVVAAELGLTVNAALIAKSRVLQQLRRQAGDLVG
jgi:DNA-directed RNA polymerase specialized sigma24 family protein